MTLAGADYCPGYIFAVLRTAYGVGARVVTQSVVVTDVQGSSVGVMGGPSCFPDEYCGQLLPSMSVVFAAGQPVPAYGDMIDLYGVTVSGGLSPVAFSVTGHCDPELWC